MVDASDDPVAGREQVVHRTAGPGRVVDVDARRVQVRTRPLEDDREALPDELGQLVVVGPRAGHDQPVDPLRAEQIGVCAVARRQRLDEHAIAARAGRRGQAPQGLRQQGVGRDLLRRLAQDEPEGQALRRRRAVGQGCSGDSPIRARPPRPSATCRSGSARRCRPFNTNDTVVRDTPARAATSALVGRRRGTSGTRHSGWGSWRVHRGWA